VQILTDRNEFCLFKPVKAKDWENIVREMKSIFTIEETKIFERIYYFLASLEIFDYPRTTQLLVINRLLSEVRKKF
jgi:hypothetical protein